MRGKEWGRLARFSGWSVKDKHPAPADASGYRRLQTLQQWKKPAERLRQEVRRVRQRGHRVWRATQILRKHCAENDSGFAPSGRQVRWRRSIRNRRKRYIVKTLWSYR